MYIVIITGGQKPPLNDFSFNFLFGVDSIFVHNKFILSNKIHIKSTIKQYYKSTKIFLKKH